MKPKNNTRGNAIKWWNSLDNYSKNKAIAQYVNGAKFLGRNLSSLTGRECEELYVNVSEIVPATPSPLPETGKTVTTEAGEVLPMNDVETHILYYGQWVEIQEDQDNEFYFLFNGKVFYIDYPNPIPETETGVTKSVEWFMALPVSKRIELANKYFPEYKHDDTDLEDSEIHEVYLKETATPPTPGNERQEREGFTPGPWEPRQSRGNNKYEHKVVAPNRKTICQMEADGNEDLEEVKRNCLLIASAPAMYRALKRLLPIIEAERTQNGVSLSIRYLTEYEEAKAILNSITGGK